MDEYTHRFPVQLLTLNAPIAERRLLFPSAEMFLKEASMTNSVDPDQTALIYAPIGAVCSGSTLFTSILNSSVKKCKAIICTRRLQQTTFSDTFFPSALRVNVFFNV